MGCFALPKPLILHAVISFWSLNIFSFVVFKHVLALVLDHKDLMKNTYEKGDLERLTCQLEMSTNVCPPCFGWHFSGSVLSVVSPLSLPLINLFLSCVQ